MNRFSPRTILPTMLIATLCVSGCGRETPKANPPATGNEPIATQPAVVSFPELPTARQIKPGISFQEAAVVRNGVSMRVWYYAPAAPKTAKLPLVVVPPAGSTLFVGMGLGDGDREEHYPYVKAGFAVVSFEIDGDVPNMQKASDAEIGRAAKAFKAANFGIANAQTALDFVLAKVPAIDADRVFTAGHSSAGTLALQFAASDPRVKGCAAYAAVTNLRQRLAPVLPALDQSIPGMARSIDSVSPSARLTDLKCPVFLFHATDDSNVPPTQSTAFAAALKATNPNVTLVTTKRGGHYESMINEGMPQAIAWMSKLKS